MTITRLRGRTKRFSRRGTALVEFAIVLPLLMLLLLGIVEIGNLLFVRHKLINAATQGANLGQLDGYDEDMILERVHEILAQAGVNIAVDTDADIDVEPPDPPDFVGITTVTVTVETTYAEVSIFGGFLPDSWVMKTTCTTVR